MLQKILVVLLGLIMSILSALTPAGLFASKPDEPLAATAADAVDEVLATVRIADGAAFAKLSVLWVEVDGKRVTDDAWGTGTLQALRFQVGVKDVESLSLVVGDKVVPLKPTDVFTIRGFHGDFAYRGISTSAASLQLQGTVKTTLLDEGKPTGKLQTTSGIPVPSGEGRVARSATPGDVDRVAYVVLGTGQSVDTVSVEVGGSRILTQDDEAPTSSGAGNLLVKWVKLEGQAIREYTWGDGQLSRIEFEPYTADEPQVAFGQQGVRAPAAAQVLVKDFVGEYLVYQVAGGMLRLRLDGYAASVTTGAESGVPIERLPGAPIAAFEVGPEVARTTDLVTFKDRTLDDGILVFWRWDFGDGTSVVMQDATHRYAKPGLYNVTLNVTDDDLNSAYATRTIIVRNADPVADFDTTPRIVATDMLVQFTDRSLDTDGLITNWTWTFADDDSVSYARHPSHRFVHGGEVKVTLTVTDDLGGRATSTREVLVRNSPPLALFTFSPTAPISQTPVRFASESHDRDGRVALTEWNFGDDPSNPGTQAVGTEVSHAFRSAGVFKVRLTVTDDLGDADTTTTEILVANQAPNATFAVSPSPDVFAEMLVTFTSTSADPDGIILFNEWSFGDGTDTVVKRAVGRCLISLDPLRCIEEGDAVYDNDTFRMSPGSERAPAPYYQPPPPIEHRFDRWGTYEVRLCVTDNLGAKTCGTRQVTVNNSAPNARLGIRPEAASRGQLIAFTAEAIDIDGDNVRVVEWRFDDGLVVARNLTVNRTYSELGTHTVTLIVEDGSPQALRSTATRSFRIVNLPPIASIESGNDVAAGQPVAFHGVLNDPDSSPGTATFRWTMPDGTTLTGQDVTWTFASVGTYLVHLQATDGEGASSGTASRQVTVRLATPEVDFSWLPGTPNEGQPVQFVDASRSYNGDIVNWTWNFGDGSPEFATSDPLRRNPTHVYADSPIRLYTVRLTARDEAGQSEIHSEVLVLNDAPRAGFAFTERVYAVGASVSFLDVSADTDGWVQQRVWDFGDGGYHESNDTAVSHAFASPGAKTVKLTVYDNNDPNVAHGSTTRIVSVADAAPVAGFFVQTSAPAAHDAVQFVSSTMTHDPDGNETLSRWSWDFGDGVTLECFEPSCRDPAHPYARSGNYVASLVVSDGILNSSAATAAVRVLSDHSAPVVVRAKYPTGTFADILNDPHIDTRLVVTHNNGATLQLTRADLTPTQNGAVFTVPATKWAENDIAYITLRDDRVRETLYAPLTKTVRFSDGDGLDDGTGNIRTPTLLFEIQLPVAVSLKAEGNGDLGLLPGTEGSPDDPVVYHSIFDVFHGTGRADFVNGEAAVGGRILIDLRYLPGHLPTSSQGQRDLRDLFGDTGDALLNNNQVIGWCMADVSTTGFDGTFEWRVDDSSCVFPSRCAGIGGVCAFDKDPVFPPGHWQARARFSAFGTQPATSEVIDIYVDPTGILPTGLLP